MDPKSSHVDTAAPIDSVKGAVTKLGGIHHWREVQKRKQAHDEYDCDKLQQEPTTDHHKRSMEAASAQALHDLRTTTSAADKLRLGLKKAQIEEAQARQEADLADRRLREVQRAATETAAAKADLESALADLRAARAELQSREKVCAAAESRETRAAVEGLAAELIALKAELESSRTALVGAEEKRLSLALALEQDKSQWQMELEDAQQEAKRLRAELMAACDVEMKAEAASQLLASLKAELFACGGGEDDKRSLPMLEEVNKELQDVKASVERARDEAKCLRAAAASMGDELAKEKAELAALRRREGLASASIPSLNDELSRLTSELAAAEATAKAANDESCKMAAQQIGEARREAEEARAKARSAREEVAKAREEAGVAKASVATMEARLEAVQREILAAATSEEMATASAAALLQESSKPPSKAVEAGGVTLTVEEYEELSRRARETEEKAGKRVMEAVKLIKEAKDAEVRILEKLAKQDRKTEQRRQALEAATLEAEEAEFDKLSAERELRQWHAEHDSQRRGAAGETESPRAGLAEISVLNDPGAGDGRGNPHIVSPRGGYMPRTELMAEADARQRKTTFFPRMVMFLARRRAQAWK